MPEEQKDESPKTVEDADKLIRELFGTLDRTTKKIKAVLSDMLKEHAA